MPKVKKNPVSQEYDLPQLIQIGINSNAKISTFKMFKEDYFQSINTKKQLVVADKKMKKKLR